ncbi:MAG: hypothetical protein NVS9B4_17340 [Candidatus Acidiferrum sp.]
MNIARKCAIAHAAALTLVLGLLCSSGDAQRREERAAAADKASPSPKEFTEAADAVLGQMSEITGLKLRGSLTKKLRSRAQIRAYIIEQMKEEKKPEERYASERTAEAFGLLPKGFDLDGFLVDLLTEQIAGLYDPKAHEFYIADWIPLADQRMVMAHELTHALEDQHFHIEEWVHAARPNDDAELAREAVLEGSAMAAMVDYLLLGTGRALKDLPEFDPSALIGDVGNTPLIEKAPPFLKDTLVFPYIAGLNFSAEILKPTGWGGLSGIFAKPPVSTQQIMHPELYRSGKSPAPVSLPMIDSIIGADWAKLDDNVMGEFGWKEVLKQFLGEARAQNLSSAWDGDRYLVYEQKKTKRMALVTRLRLASDEQGARFFGQYSEALEKKYERRSNLFRRPNFFSFDTPGGSVFLNCFDAECVTVEGANREVLDALLKRIGWPAAPIAPADPAKPLHRVAMRDSNAYGSSAKTKASLPEVGTTATADSMKLGG